MKTKGKATRQAGPRRGGKPSARAPKPVGKSKPAPKHQASATLRPKAVAPAPKPPAPRPLDRQQQIYEEAIRLFQANRFDRAEPLFRKAAQGSNRTLAHHAQAHAQMCQKRLHPLQVKLRSADDHYSYAVAMMNARRLEEAAEHLAMALRSAPRADHVHYALAAVQALRGRRHEAYESLKTAVELEPKNRLLARGDPDFAAVLDYPPLAGLLHLDRGASARRA